MSMLQDDIVLCIDPSIITAGYAVYSEEKMPRVSNDYLWHLSSFGCFQSRVGKNTIERSREIAKLIKIKADTDKVTLALIEMPAEIVYLDDIFKMQKDMQRKFILARASRVMKLFSSGNYFIGMLEEMNIEVRPILPVQWQMHKSKRKGRDVKAWSIDHANAFIKSEGSKRILSSGLGEHASDAINIGFMVLNAGKAGGISGKV